MTDPKELADAWNHLHLRNFTDFMLFALQTAARVEPEKVRELIGSVYDMKAVEDMTRRAFNLAAEANKTVQNTAAEVRALVDGIALDVQEIERKVDDLHHRLDKAAKLAAKLKGVANA